jgi:hypothetical protein
LFPVEPIGLASRESSPWLAALRELETIKGWFVEFFDWLPNKIREVAGWLKSLVPDWLKGGSVNVSMQQVSDGASDLGVRDAARPSVLQQMKANNQRTNIQGEMVMRFENAPPGLRVSQARRTIPDWP